MALWTWPSLVLCALAWPPSVDLPWLSGVSQPKEGVQQALLEANTAPVLVSLCPEINQVNSPSFQLLWRCCQTEPIESSQNQEVGEGHRVEADLCRFTWVDTVPGEVGQDGG